MRRHFTADGSKVSIRPSGTEPKIKFYIEAKAVMESAADYENRDPQWYEVGIICSFTHGRYSCIFYSTGVAPVNDGIEVVGLTIV